MKQKTSLSILSAAVLFGLLTSAILTVPALADGGSTDPSQTPSAGGSSTRNAPSSATSGVPSGTKLVVLDSSGNKVALGSQQAADLLSSGDPIWCPATVVVPMGSGLNGCTLSQANLSDLITAIEAGNGFSTTGLTPNANGTIWIFSSLKNGGNDSSSSPIVIDATDGLEGSWGNFTLTIKGGWKGFATSAIDTLHPSTFNVPITIEDWSNTVTVSDIVVTGATGTGLTVQTSKGVALTRVQSTANTGAGISVNAGSTILLSGVTASGNTGGAGAVLDNTSGPSIALITVNGVSSFNNNHLDGLDVNAKGAVSITDLTASGNGLSGTSGFGAVIDNTVATASNVTMGGTNVFVGNFNGGLKVTSNGTITANTVIANSNGNASSTTPQYGASFDNSGAALSPAVTLTGSSSFKFNGEDGLDITSKGTITANNITATNNGYGAGLSGPYYGAKLDNTAATSAAAVKITGTNNYFYFNLNDGLNIASLGSVSAVNVAANENGHDGVFIRNDTSVKPAGVTFTGANVFSLNSQAGLDISSKGAITLNSVTAKGNIVGEGVVLENDAAPKSAQAVTLTGVNVFTGNGETGLWVKSYGNISVSNVTANINGAVASAGFEDGATLVNTNPGALVAVNVTLTGVNTFNANGDTTGGSGLTITTFGAVNASNLSAANNTIFADGRGVVIDNHGPSSLAVAGVTLTGVNQFVNNNADGLLITSNGAVTLSGVAASLNGGNGGSGVTIDNSFISAKNVKLNGTNSFNQNVNTGLSVTSKGSITGNNLTAVLNGLNGATLDNSAGPASSSITLTGTNIFTNNAADGLDLNSHGAVSLTKVTADCNGFSAGGGCGAAGPGNGVTVTHSSTFILTCGSLINNTNGFGLQVTATGAATLKGVFESGNLTNQSITSTTLTTARTCPLP